MKKSIKTFALAAGLLAAAGSVQAAPLEINIYGASAQFAFLSAVAGDILTSAGVGCAAAPSAGPTAISTYYAVTYPSNGNSTKPCVNGITLRVANKSSVDGIKAALQTTGGTVCQSAPSNLSNDYRQFINPGDTAAPTSANVANNAPNPNRCFPVTLAASDVDKGSFNETSNGCQFGPQYDLTAAAHNTDGGVPAGILSCAAAPTKTCTNKDNTKKEYCYLTKSQGAVPDTNNYLLPKNPMIVPFAFWANNSLQVDKCAQNAALTEKHVGQVCDKNNAGFPCDVAADCKTQPLDDLSRIQAANILSGSIGDVSQLGPSYSTTSGGGADTFIRVCLRHAGSGTQSTLHNAVENADKWVAQKLAIDGDSLCNPGSVGDTNTYQGGVLTALNWPACLPANVATNADLQSFIFFNDSTDDLLNCVNSTPNAIGIADADACNAATANASPYITPASNVYNTNLCANIHSLSYNGYAPTRWNVRDGLYEFWTKENLYLNQHLYPSTSNEYKFFTAFNSAISPSFLTYAKVGDSAYIWATTAEMNYSKLDKTHPGYSGGGTQKP